jgi:hypothetical protein
MCNRKKNQTNKEARGRASEENAATRKEKRRKHRRKQELRKNIRHKNAIAKKKNPPPLQSANGGVGVGGSFVFSAQENYFYHLPWPASSKLHLFSVLIMALPSIPTSIYPLNQPLFFFYWP